MFIKVYIKDNIKYNFEGHYIEHMMSDDHLVINELPISTFDILILPHIITYSKELAVRPLFIIQ